jgi:ParB-like chromosome segregation protein Spo0J
MKKKAGAQAEKHEIIPALRRNAVPVAELVSDPANVRLHDERNLEAIIRSLEAFGQQAPVLFTAGPGGRVVIKGNGVLAAARKLGWTHVAAIQTPLAGPEATAYAIADNRTTDLSGFDDAALAAQLQELEESEFDIAAAGFTDEELQELVEAVDEPPGAVGRPAGTERHRGERTALFLAGHLKFEVPRQDFDRWHSELEAKVGNDPDRVVREIKRRLRL